MTAAYLINHTPSVILKHWSPMRYLIERNHVTLNFEYLGVLFISLGTKINLGKEVGVASLLAILTLKKG